jgi:hypothetical protein
MKHVLAFCVALAALFVAHARANDYVCELSISPSSADPTRGSFGYITMYTTPQQNCSGAMSLWFICSRNATNHYCGVDATYSEPMLIGVYEMLRNAEADQHPVVPAWDACVNAGGSCTANVLLFPDF